MNTPPPSNPPVSSVLCTKFPTNGYRFSECTIDNGLQHYVWLDPTLPTGLANALRNSIAEDYDSIDGIYSAETTGSNVRVRVLFANFNPEWPRAFTFCDEYSTTGLNNVRYHMWCKPQIIIFQDNPVAWSTCWSYAGCRRWLACHELGHTLGLQHSTSEATCMTISAWKDVLNAHDIGHLEDCYPHPTQPLPTYPAESRSTTCKFQ